MTATLLPNGEQQFIDQNGEPYAGGSVYFYIPSTTTPKTTWKDAGQSVPNTNPVILDSAGRAIIYGSGQYRQVLFDSLGNEVWDQLTQDVYSLFNQGTAIWGGTAGGTANALTLTTVPDLSVLADGQLVAFIASAANTTAVTVNIDGLGAEAITQMTSGGLAPLVAGNLINNGRYLMFYDGSQFVLLDPTEAAANNSFVNVASATTTNLGTAGSNNINITGTTNITSFGSGAVVTNPLYYVEFSGSLLITAGSNILTPNSQNIQTQAGDFAILQYNGTGVWTILSYYTAGNTSIAIGTAINAAATVTTASQSLQFFSDQVVAGITLGGPARLITSYSQIVNIATTGAGGYDTGTPPANGFIAVYVIFGNSGTSILACNASTTSNGTVYSGANMPAGYAYSCIIGIWPTNGSAQFIVGSMRGRKINYAKQTISTALAAQSSLSAVSISGSVPPSAISWSGYGGGNPGNASLIVAGDGAGTGEQIAIILSAGGGSSTYEGVGFGGNFTDVTIISPQITFYATDSSTAQALYITGYMF